MTATGATRRAGARIGKLVGGWYWNTADAARAMNVSYWTLYRVIGGTRTPTAEFLKVCADHFGITVDSLLSENPTRRRPEA